MTSVAAIISPFCREDPLQRIARGAFCCALCPPRFHIADETLAPALMRGPMRCELEHLAALNGYEETESAHLQSQVRLLPYQRYCALPAPARFIPEIDALFGVPACQGMAKSGIDTGIHP